MDPHSAKDPQRRLRAAMRDLHSARSRADHAQAAEELAVLASLGVEEALPELLSAIIDQGLATAAVRRVLANQSDVDDAVQATLITVADKIGSFEGRSKFSTWLARVARNEALMIVRRHVRELGRVEAMAAEPSVAPRALSSIIADGQALIAGLDSLSADQREVLALREFDGLSYDEIAHRLGVPIGTVRSRISRARDELERFLHASLGAESP